MTAIDSHSDLDRRRRSARWLIVCAAVLWSSGGFFAKAPFFAGWPGPVLACWRALFASLVLIPLVRKPRWTWRLIPAVLLFAVMNYTYLSSMALTEASNAIWLQSTSPLWIFLVGVLVLREPMHPRDGWLLGFCGLGLATILFFELRETRPEARLGVIYGLFSGMAYGGVVLSLRQLRDQESAWIVALNHATAAMLLSPFVVQAGVWPSGWQWLFLVAFGVLQMGVPYVLFAHSLRTLPGHEAATLGLLEPILVPVWVFVAWRNHPTYTPPSWPTLIGASLILLGLFLRYGIKPESFNRVPSGPRGTA